MTIYNLTVKLDDEMAEYLISSARIRRVSRKILLNNILEIVIREKMIVNVLDDDSKPMNIGRRTRVPRWPRRQK